MYIGPMREGSEEVKCGTKQHVFVCFLSIV